MNALPHDGSVTTADWNDLTRELEFWRKAGRTATLWWRDDDAVEPNPRLETLLAIAGKTPVVLAVIPAMAEPGLASLPGSVGIVQHGWRHTNHGGSGKKNEFPGSRSRQSVTAEFTEGRERLAALFGNRALAVLAPPWNRLDPAFLPLLPACGVKAVSRTNPRSSAWPASGVFEANVHVDL